MFEKAARNKMRFSTSRGALSAEDLWDLDVESLDGLYKALMRAVKAQNEDSLLDTRSEVNEVLDCKVAIVRRIVEVKLTEAQEREQAAERKARKQRLYAILADKQDEELRGMSVEELQAEIDSL